MNWNEYKQHLKDEWEFHKRNPEMLLVWGMLIGWFIYCLLEK